MSVARTEKGLSAILSFFSFFSSPSPLPPFFRTFFLPSLESIKLTRTDTTLLPLSRAEEESDRDGGFKLRFFFLFYGVARR